MRMYIVSTCLWRILWPTSCHMFNVTHRNDFVTQNVSRHPYFSVWTRAWTRLVVDTLRGNMSVEPKHRKLWDKLYTYTFSHEKICMRTRPCKSKSCAEERFFSQWVHITVLRVGKTNDLWHNFVCEKLHTYTSSCVKICTWRRPRKSNKCRDASFSENLHVVTSRSWYNYVETRRIGWTNGKSCSKLHIIMDSCVKRCVQTHFLTANMSHSAFSKRKKWKLSTQTCPRMSKVAHGRVLVRQNGTDSYRGQSFFVNGVYILWWLCTRIYWVIWLGKTAVNVWTNVRGWVEHV